MYLNKAIIIGNLTRDPELKSLPSGIQVASFSVATNRVWKDKSGAKQESADYHNVVVFGRQAEIVSQYMKKGSSILVEGRMQTRSWEAKDGEKKYRTEIIADRIQFGQRGGSAQPSQNAPAGKGGADSQSAPAVDKNQGIDTIEYPEEEINPEDIPF
ncbi:MAG: single-stranded DNA-binding protein [bacterium]|nr:single-stranded DNA-binding protein [bacterium]